MLSIANAFWTFWVDFIMNMCSQNAALASAASVCLVEFFFFYLPCVLFEIFEPQLEGKRIEKNKATREEVTKRAWRDVSIVVFVVHPVLFYGLSRKMGSTLEFDTQLPTLLDFVKVYVSGLFCNDFFFYWSHRLFHEVPALYKLHKIHHEFNFTRGIASQYCHPIEGVVCNTLPSFMNLIIWYYYYGQVHVTLVMFWVGYRLLETLDAHNGFFIHFCYSPTHMGDLGEGKYGVHHYFHHSHNTGNYGTPLLDWLFGTDVTYRNYIEKKKAKLKKA
jgi:sterol desaturase/sphingolipid hydroxylase (fatty acid hydroxylase superfamily)